MRIHLFLFLSLSFNSLASYGQIPERKVNMHQPIAAVLDKANCYMKVVNRPIKILANDHAAYAGGLVLATKRMSRKDRVLKVNETFNVGRMSTRQFSLSGWTLGSGCLSLNGLDCALLTRITFPQIEASTQGNVRFTCYKSSTLPWVIL